MEDNGTMPLREYLQTRRPDMLTFFSIAIQLTEALGVLHQKSIIYRKLNTDAICIHPGTGCVTIADFSKAAPMADKDKPELFTGTFAETRGFLSPEQIGLMQGSIDYRSDLYALGVVLYEILTGQLPLQAANYIQWVHAHLAQKPLYPGKIKPDIPPAISTIVMKLLAKAADERYQSACGLLVDLEECRRQWTQTGVIRLFALGRADFSLRLQLPKKLYGRKKEAAAIKAAYLRICTGLPELLLVHGAAGTGKTILVHETLRPFAVRRGYFITGRFAQFQRDMPYGPLVQAFAGLIKQILTERPENFTTWKRILVPALGRSGAVITDVIPELELIVGPQPPAEKLQPREAQNRFYMILRNMVRVLARRGCPLVIFLDDLQWADMEALSFIKYLSEDADSNYLLIIGAYRDNEVSGQHPLLTTLAELQKTEILVQHLPLMPLGLDHLKKFVADTIGGSEEQLQPLAEILYLKTGGNPYLLGQLLQAGYALIPMEQKKMAHLQITRLIRQNTVQDVLEEEIINVREGRSTSDPVLYAIREAVQKTVQETDTETLLKSFLEMTIEHAGADKGYLMLEKAGKMYIEAVKECDTQTVSMITPLSMEKSANLSRAMVRYVIRTLEPMVLNDIEQAGIFVRDPYIVQSRAKAIVCLPLLFRKIPVGVLYLENSQLSGVFTPDRLEILKIFAIQLAYIRKINNCLTEDTIGTNDETPIPLIEPFAERLTERELEVLSLIADGMSNQEIGQELQLTVSTVKTHILNIYGKLRVNRRVQAVTRANELRLLKTR